MSMTPSYVKRLKQPRGGYLSPSMMSFTQIKDDMYMNDENIGSEIIKPTLDLVLRSTIVKEKDSLFKIIRNGAKRAKTHDFPTAPEEVEALIETIDMSNIRRWSDDDIITLCRLAIFDTWQRNINIAINLPRPSEIRPNKDTIRNIRTMIQRSIRFFETKNGLKAYQFGFERNNTDPTKSNVQKSPGTFLGIGDALTEDTLWEIRIANNKLTHENTLKVLLYYFLGKQSGNPIFDSILNIGFFNPKTNQEHTYAMNNLPIQIRKELTQFVKQL